MTCYDPNIRKCCGNGYGTTCGINEFCCDDGSCVSERCKTIDGQDCSQSNNSFCGGCALDDSDCGWQANAKIYEGGKEKICNPHGCPGDCDSGKTKLCYTEYPCMLLGVFYLFEECSTFVPQPPPLPPMPTLPTCISVFPIPTTCWPCWHHEAYGQSHRVRDHSCLR